MGMFKEILSVKSFREDKAERVMVKQRSVLEEAAIARDRAEQARDGYREWAVAQERSLFAALCQRVVQLRDIEDMQVEVTEMRTQEERHEEQLRQAEANRQKQEQQLEADRRAHRDATRMKEKFAELARLDADAQFREFERREEAELEEVAGQLRPGGAQAAAAEVSE